MKYSLCFLLVITVLCMPSSSAFAKKPKIPAQRKAAIEEGLGYLKRMQYTDGHWRAGGRCYNTAMTALAGMALLGEGSTTSTGRYSKSIQKAVDYLIQQARPNGLIGAKGEKKYLYGHGFSLLFLSQVYGKEKNSARRKRLRQVLGKAVKFTLEAQTSQGGWGYVSAKDGNNFAECSACLTQVQSLRACRNAGISVPLASITVGKKYLVACRIENGREKGGVINRYHTGNIVAGARPAITAAACASIFTTKEYKEKGVQEMLAYCEKNVWPGGNKNADGHPHYKHYYYAQVAYRLGDKKWQKYIADVGRTIISQQADDGSWKTGAGKAIGTVYMTALNLTVLQLDKALIPIYQR